MELGSLSERQRQAMADLLHDVFVRLRSPGYGYFWQDRSDYDDLENLSKVSKSFDVVSEKLKKDRHVELLRLEKWLEAEEEAFDRLPLFKSKASQFLVLQILLL